jgi:hypothetical protein
VTYKTCLKCEVSKPVTSFAPKRGVRDGLQSWCRDCVRRGQTWHYRNNPKAQFRYSRNNAARRGLSWDLDFTTWDFLRSQPCDYCGLKIETKIGSLDRLDNSKGYELGNVVPCCFICNTMRNDIWTPVEMRILGAVVGSLIRLRLNPVGEPILPKRARPKGDDVCQRRSLQDVSPVERGSDMTSYRVALDAFVRRNARRVRR